MSVQVADGYMDVDGEKSLLFSGEVEYWRLDPDDWRIVLERLKETGMDWVSSYVPWRVHEQGRHDYDLTGETSPRLDLPAYLDVVAEMGLKMYFRPGPLIVSEMAAGGYPQWLVEEDNSILVWDNENKIPDGFKGYGGVPCYLHPDYLDHCRTWLSAVNDIAVEYLAPSGPISLYQLDNEVSLVCKDGMFDSDYNPHIVGPGGVYHQWLKDKYGSPGAIPYAGGAESIEEIEPPRSLDAWGDRPVSWWWDWAEFKEYYLARYVEKLRHIHEDCGVDGVTFCTNFNPHRPNTVPNNWKKYEEAADGLVGYDFYRSPFISYTGYLSLARISRMLNAWMDLPWSAEFMGGIWREDFGGGGYPYAEHHEVVTDIALANGLKGLAWYMFHDRESWGAAPVSDRGHKRYAHDALSEAMNFVRGCDDFSSLEIEGNVGVLHYRPYHVHTFLGDSMPANDNEVHTGRPEVGGVPAGLSSIEWEGVFGLLMDAGYSPVPVDPEINPESLEDLDAVWVVTEAFMDPETASLLWDFARNGGAVIMGPEIPCTALDGEPLMLPEGLSKPTALCSGTTRVQWQGEDVTFYKRLHTHPGRSIIELGDTPVVSATALGQGALIYVGGYIAQDLDGHQTDGNIGFADRLMELCDIAPPVSTGCRDIHCVMQSNESEAYVFITNLSNRSQLPEVCFYDDAPATLRDVRNGDQFKVEAGSVEVPVDCKRSRILQMRYEDKE
ncbi:MAG: beta-galactosidase [Planctomycetota bacterium]